MGRGQGTGGQWLCRGCTGTAGHSPCVLLASSGSSCLEAPKDRRAALRVTAQPHSGTGATEPLTLPLTSSPVPHSLYWSQELSSPLVFSNPAQVGRSQPHWGFPGTEPRSHTSHSHTVGWSLQGWCPHCCPHPEPSPSPSSCLLHPWVTALSPQGGEVRVGIEAGKDRAGEQFGVGLGVK